MWQFDEPSPTDEDMARAVALVPELDRAVCRQEAQRRFSLERMAIDHDRLYRQLRHRPGEHRARKRAIGHIHATRRKDGIGPGMQRLCS
jgi:hypothetical protein